MKVKASKCPYCGYDLGLIETLHIKENITYTCARCKNVSRVSLDDKIKLLIILLVAISLAIIVIFSVMIKRFFLGAMLIALISAVFYALVPLFINLEKDNTRSKN